MTTAPIRGLAAALIAVTVAGQSIAQDTSAEKTENEAQTQMAGPPPENAPGVMRTWAIVFKSGEMLDIEAPANWTGPGKGPSALIADFETYISSGNLPAVPRYSLPIENRSAVKATEIVVDMREVVAIIQKF